jgi:hypothetical protein
MNLQNYLTKSLFKIGFECPAKLRYAKDASYGNNQKDNEFLQALAEGGFQVGELAKLMFSDGVEVTEIGHFDALSRTTEHLAKGNITIFEAALADSDTHARYFVRVDVLRIQGNTLDIIEVKSKSYDPYDEGFFKTSQGFASKTLPYLLDVAFQTYVARLALPRLDVRSFLLLPDKSKAATVGGLNQLFPVIKLDSTKRRVTCVPIEGLTLDKVGEPLLTLLDVTDLVNELLQQVFDIPGMSGSIPQLAQNLAGILQNPKSVHAPIQAQCKSCEFRLPPSHPKRSGLDECWNEAITAEGLNAARLQAREPLVVDLWDGRRASQWISQGKRFLKELGADDLPLSQEPDKLTRTHRQWLQINGEGLNQDGYWFDADLYRREMDRWHWPINLIDFETSRTALPFHLGGKPYGLVAFQWSHHVLHEDGRLEHVDDFLMTEPGQTPNLAFLQSLRQTLSRNQGSVMMWSPYENSVLNGLLENLRSELTLAGINPSARDSLYRDLVEFIESLTVKKQNKKVLHQGSRAMVDLCDLSSQGFFHRQAGGSNSIKKVLPAMLSANDFLRDLYSQPIYGSVDQKSVTPRSFNSRQFKNPMTWWQLDEKGYVIDPYQLLPPVFSDISAKESDEDTVINQGGAAAAAYGRVQLESISEQTRDAWRSALLKYCELDTLAMAMIVQGWRAWLKSNSEGSTS